ncbi:MAG TPA: hypothetical protein VGQ57_19670 [Polyangiaceae bacterium]|nr:hypothetical protein [Polyangiaceae bacterium]
MAVLLAGCAKSDNRAEALGLTSSGVAAASSAEPKVGVSEACTRICERSQVLKCKNADQCLVNCVAAAAGTPCTGEFLTFYRCLVPQPIGNWECAEDGVAAVKPGTCDAEQDHAIQCMKAKAAP